MPEGLAVGVEPSASPDVPAASTDGSLSFPFSLFMPKDSLDDFFTIDGRLCTGVIGDDIEVSPDVDDGCC